MTETIKRPSITTRLVGAAFLMATSAIGPGFLTQTAAFTKQLAASFAFVILVSIVIDIIVQLNIWRILSVSGLRGSEAANAGIPGSGYLLTVLVALGGLVFNIGNLAGCGLGLNAATGLAPEYGAVLSSVIAVAIFAMPGRDRLLDHFVKVLGLLMTALIVYVTFLAGPPILDAAKAVVWPEKLNAAAIVTLVGGTVGGYISFAGAHRLIEAGITGPGSIKTVDRGAVGGILLTAVMRILFFLAALGVVTAGLTIDDANPPASVFRLAAGDVGYRIFGIVMWAAAITSVVGAAFTSISFLRTIRPAVDKSPRSMIIWFILISLLIFLLFGSPVKLLIMAGLVNGFVLPFGLAMILIAARRGRILGDYQHPLWLETLGWAVVLVMAGFSVSAIVG